MNKLTFSLLLVALCASACLARTSPQTRRQFKFTPGQTYIYEYRGRQWNGLPKLADQYSGLTLDADVMLQALPESQGTEVVMKLDGIKIEQLHTQSLDTDDIRKLNSGREHDERQESLYKEELSKPIRFTYMDGKVVRFVADSSDQEWSINIKKSILSLFQLDMTPNKIIKSHKSYEQQNYDEAAIASATEMPLVYPVYEESFGGICETLYEIDSVDNVEQRDQQDSVEFNDVLNVTKTVNYKNCLTDPSVSYDRHSFQVNTQTAKGKLFSETVADSQYYQVPEDIKQKYSNAYTSQEQGNNVASPVPVERHSYTKYNITTAPQSSQYSTSGRYQQQQQQAGYGIASSQDASLIEAVYSEGKIKYAADGDTLFSDTQQSLKLIAYAPSQELARVAPQIATMAAEARQASAEYHTIQLELNAQKAKFYQALWKVAQLKQSLTNTIGGPASSNAFYSHQLALPFALSASWYPVVATGQQSQEEALERLVDPDSLAKIYEQLLASLADDVLTDDVAQSKHAGEKVVRLVNTVAFMPKHKLAQIYERTIERIQRAKQSQLNSRQNKQQAAVDSEEVSKQKIVRKLFIDSLPLAGSKQAVEMIEQLIETNRVKPHEAKEMCEATPANFRYPDTEIIDAFIRVSQMQQVRKNRAVFASCSIAVGKMIATAYAKSKDASYKPTTYEPAQKLPTHLRQDDIVRQVVEEADPRRQSPINWNARDQQDQYERLVLDDQDLIKYVKLYKQLLSKAGQQHEKIIYIETLAHMKAPQVVPVLEPFVTGRLSLAQCLGQQPLDIKRPIEQSQWYNYYGRAQRVVKQQQQQQQSQKDWNEEDSYAAEECNYMRTIAIYALAHVARAAPNKVQAMLLPVFDNTYEPYQIRIAAFTTMILAPVPEHILERVASQMWREPNKDVASFVVGAIDTMSKLTSPQDQPWKYAAMKAADSMPKQYLDTWKYSWMAGGDHYNRQKDTGLSWVAEIIKSNVSSIPRGAYAKLGRSHGPAGAKYDNYFELGFTSKGLESLLKDYLAYNRQQEATNGDTNIVASIFETLYDSQDDIVKYYRDARDAVKASLVDSDSEEQQSAHSSESSNYFFKRQQPIDGVNSQSSGNKQQAARQASQLFEGAARTKRSVTFQARKPNTDDEDAQEEAKLTIFSKLFDQTSYHALDKKQIIAAFEKSDDYIKMAAEELIMGGKLHYVKMMMPDNMWHMVPSQLGLPVIVTHRTPIVASIKIDGANNGQYTSSPASQYVRQQQTGPQIPNTYGQNFAAANGLNITALVHPKIMYSSYRFMFAVEQAKNEAYGAQVEKSHQFSAPMEVSVAYSLPKQLVSLTIEPKTPSRMIWTKKAAKTYIAPVALANSPFANWLGQEQLIRVPSMKAQYKRVEHPEYFVPSLLNSVHSLWNEPKKAQAAAIDDLNTPYKFEHRFIQELFGVEFDLEGVTDDAAYAASVPAYETTSTLVHGPNEARDQASSRVEPSVVPRSTGQAGFLRMGDEHAPWATKEDIDELDQHSKSGPFGEVLHVLESAKNRPSKYLEYYYTLKPTEQKSPVYRFDFMLNGPKYQQHHQQQSAYNFGRNSQNQRLNIQSQKMQEAIENAAKSSKYMLRQAPQANMLEVY